MATYRPQVGPHTGAWARQNHPVFNRASSNVYCQVFTVQKEDRQFRELSFMGYIRKLT